MMDYFFLDQFIEFFIAFLLLFGPVPLTLGEPFLPNQSVINQCAKNYCREPHNLNPIHF